MAGHFGADATSGYRNRAPAQVPGYHDLLRITTLLLSEAVPADGSVLVLGAGGGLELDAMASAQPGWRFYGVDPSVAMLDAARAETAAHADRITLHPGTIEVAPLGPFDGATCLLTFHFIPRAERLPTLVALRQRLRKGAPLVLAHISFPQAEPERSRWIARHVAFGRGEAVGAPQSADARDAIATRLSILDPAEEEAMLRAAGFSDVSLVYAGLSLRGWVATAD